MLRLLSAIAIVLGVSATVAHAQCPAVPANLAMEEGVCSFRLSWSVPPPGQVATVVVRRGTTGVFNTSIPITTLSPITPFHIDTPPDNREYTYWVVFLPSNSQCQPAISAPISGRRLVSSSFAPDPLSVTSSCASIVTITGRSVFDATGYRLLRRAPGEGVASFVGSPQSSPVFFDAPGVTGGPFNYAVVPVGDCGQVDGLIGDRPVYVAGPPSITAGPSMSVDYGASVGLNFTLRIGDNGGTVTLFRDGVPIAPPTIAPPAGFTHSIGSAKYSDAGTYVLRVTTPCGTAESSPLVLAVREKPCTVDFNDNNARDIDDVFIFLNAWFAGCP
jgi:hypothetical protein